MRRAAVQRLMGAAIGLWLVAVGAAIVTAQGRGAREDMSAYLPPGAGRELVVSNCTTCHDLRGTVRLRQSPTAWEALVLDMGARGAPLTMDDVDPLAKYLGSVFGPDSPPFTDVSVATREDMVKVPGVTQAAADRLLAQRQKTPLASHDEVRTALGMDPQEFEKIRHYLYVKPPKQDEGR